jgi:WD40 repeat protein
VATLAVSRDGSRLATGGLDRKLRVYDIATKTLISEAAGHSLPVNSVDFAPDGALVATASGDQKLRIFEAQTGVLKLEASHFQGNQYAVRYVDATTIALAGSRPGGVKLINAATGAERSMLDGQTDEVIGLAVSGNGKTLATLSSDRTAKIWELPAGKVARSYQMEETGRALAMAADGARLAVATSQGLLRLYELSDTGQGVSLPRAASALGGVVWLNSGSIVTCGSTGSLRMALADGSRSGELQLGGALGALAATPDGTWIAAGGVDRAIRLYKGPELKPGPVLEGHQNTIVDIAISADGRLMASADSNRQVLLWKLGESRPLSSWKEAGRVPCSLAFSADGSQLAVGSADGTIVVRAGGTGKMIAAGRGTGSPVLSLAFSPTGDRLAGGCANGHAVVWEVARLQEPPAVFTGHTTASIGPVWNPVQAVAFHPDGRRIASAGADQTVRVWDSRTRAADRSLVGHGDWITGLAFSPSGDGLASVGAGGETRIWSVENAPIETVPPGHAREVRTLAFSNDGKQLASGGQDTTVRIWDVATGRQVGLYEGGAASVQQVAWVGPQSLLAACGDRQMRLWDLVKGTSSGQFPLNGQGNPNTLHAIEGSRRAMVWVGDGQVEFHDLEGKVPRETWSCFEPASQVTALAMGPKGHQIAVGGRNGQTRLWDIRKREKIWKEDLPAHSGPIIDVALPDAATGRLVTADMQGLKIWNIAKREATRQMPLGMGQNPRQLAVSAQGDRVAAACQDGHVRVWNADTGAQIADMNFLEQLPHDKPYFLAMAFAPSGRLLAASGPGGRIYMMTIP